MSNTTTTNATTSYDGKDPIIGGVKLNSVNSDKEVTVDVALSQLVFQGQVYKYARPVFNTIQDVVDAYGVDYVLDCVNGDLKARLVSKCKNLLSDSTNPSVQFHDNIVLGVDDLVDYAPGVRESKKEKFNKLWEVVEEKLNSNTLSSEEAIELLTKLGALRNKRSK